MQQFVVPQFIDIENKIFGPVTARQFVLLIIWGVLEFGAFKIFDTVPFVIATILMGLFFAPMAFYKPNGKPFHYFLLAVYKAKTRPDIRVWHNHDILMASPEIKSNREMRDAKRKETERQFSEKRTKPSRLSELSLIADTGGIYEGEQTEEELEKEMENLQKPKL
ncbi:MAG: PrgI family protein [Patescibacteria group bacterium]